MIDRKPHLIRSGKTINRQSGFATVEAAIVLPLLVILLLVSAEFGRLFYYSNEFTKSVRDATRYLSNNALVAKVVVISDANSVIAKNLVVYGDVSSTGSPKFPGLSVNDITVTTSDPYISVSGNWTYTTMFGTALPALGLSTEENYTLKAAMTMRALD